MGEATKETGSRLSTMNRPVCLPEPMRLFVLLLIEHACLRDRRGTLVRSFSHLGPRLSIPLPKGGVSMFSNRLCRDVGHDWRCGAVVGFFSCLRQDCGAIGHCPQCLGYRRSDLVVTFCSDHERYASYRDEYQVVTPEMLGAAPAFDADAGSVQAALW